MFWWKLLLEVIKVLIATGAQGGRRSAHLNMDQSDGFEHPSRSGFVEGKGGGKGGGWVRGITPIVCYTFMLCTKIDCLMSSCLMSS